MLVLNIEFFYLVLCYYFHTEHVLGGILVVACDCIVCIKLFVTYFLYSISVMTRRKPVTKGEETTGVSQELNKKLRMVEESKMKLVDENDEDDTKVEQLTSTDLKSTQSTRSKRGRTQMHCLSMQRGQGIKIDVKFNENWQPVEQAGTQMQSYIGVLVRERLKITYEDWDSVPTEEKELIWESVNVSFYLNC